MSEPVNLRDLELYERVERLFNLKVSSSGADITITLGDQSMTVPYEAFLTLRQSIEQLILLETQIARQEPVGDAIEIKVPKETMLFVMSKIKLQPKTIARRVLVPEWLVEKWLNGSADNYDLEVHIWRLKVLASLTRRYNWMVFLLKPDNLPK